MHHAAQASHSDLTADLLFCKIDCRSVESFFFVPCSGLKKADKDKPQMAVLTQLDVVQYHFQDFPKEMLV